MLWVGYSVYVRNAHCKLRNGNQKGLKYVFLIRELGGVESNRNECEEDWTLIQGGSRKNHILWRWKVGHVCWSCLVSIRFTNLNGKDIVPCTRAKCLTRTKKR